jgi:hypothetical protein
MRVRPPEFTPAVLRVEDGSCTPGELEMFSVTGGLLSLPKLLDQGSRVKLMFLTQTGTVLGVAEMLKPVSWDEQPFRFVSLHENDQRKLKAATVPFGTPEPVEAEARPKPVLLPLPTFEPRIAALHEKEQQWIEKYRTAISNETPRRRLPRILFAVLTLATLGMGILYALQLHLLR